MVDLSIAMLIYQRLVWWFTYDLASKKINSSTLAVIGIGRWVKPLNNGYFQGLFNNLPERIYYFDVDVPARKVFNSWMALEIKKPTIHCLEGQLETAGTIPFPQLT